MHTRISLAQFGVLFAVLVALGAVAHAGDTRVCGKVVQVTATETRSGSGVQTYASVALEGGRTQTISLAMAQLALTARAAGQHVCFVDRVIEHPAVDQGSATTETSTEITIEDEVHP